MFELPAHLWLVAANSSDSDGGAFGLLFLLSGFLFYGVVYMKYRNVGARHHYETETQVTKLKMEKTDQLVESLKGLSNAHMRGANNTEVDGAGGALGALGSLGGLTSQLGSIVTTMQSQAGVKPSGTVASTTSAPGSHAAPSPPPPPPGGEHETPGGAAF